MSLELLWEGPRIWDRKAIGEQSAHVRLDCLVHCPFGFFAGFAGGTAWKICRVVC